jgi:hypothetical protein
MTTGATLGIEGCFTTAIFTGSIGAAGAVAFATTGASFGIIGGTRTVALTGEAGGTSGTEISVRTGGYSFRF